MQHSPKSSLRTSFWYLLVRLPSARSLLLSLCSPVLQHGHAMASGPQAEGMAQEGAMSCPEAHWLDYGVEVCSAQELSVKINQGPLVAF